ncbi:mechanosensitive ion channel family protein [Roseomonas sp. BN140053]|uniref:mechanosensitive ion channel family protein n=1 Tax=Roseomonas sp. BN140053 TaxID=3391898 RepID=UPI0039E7B54D
MEHPEQLTDHKLQSMAEGFFWLLPNIGIGLLVLLGFILGGYAASRTVRFAFGRRGRAELGDLLGAFLRWGLIFVGALVFCTVVFPSVKPSDLLATLGVGSVAVGLAFRDILQNWLSGLLILYSRPFRAGDQIVSGAHEGTVERVEARATLLKTYDGQRVLIPNSNLYTRSIIVRTHFPVRRTAVVVGIRHDADLAAAREVVLSAVREVEGVVADPAPDAMAWEFGDSAVVMRVRWWTKSRRNEVVAARGRAVAAIRHALAEAKIDLAFPIRDLRVHEMHDEDTGNDALFPAPSARG